MPDLNSELLHGHWPMAIDDVKNEFCRFNYFLYVYHQHHYNRPPYSVYKCIIIIIINDIIYGLNFIIITTSVVLSSVYYIPGAQ